MDIETFEKKIEIRRRILLLSAGATFTMLMTAVVSSPDPLNFISILCGMWMVLMITNTSLGILLLIGRGWGTFPLSRRLNLAFSFLGLAWLSLLTFVIGMTTNLSPSSVTFTFTFFLGFFLAGLYIWLRGKTDDPEEIFP